MTASIVWVTGHVSKNVVICQECGKTCRGHFNQLGNWVSPWKVLAGHIMGRHDHYNKRWAKEFLINANVGFGDDEHEQ